MLLRTMYNNNSNLKRFDFSTTKSQKYLLILLFIR